jgi:hypothetical protein
MTTSAPNALRINNLLLPVEEKTKACGVYLHLEVRSSRNSTLIP